jgi:O-methyltransferase domain/Dimerisation domain
MAQVETADTGAAEPLEAPARTLLSLLSGAWVAQAIFIAAKLGIADILYQGPASCTELAAATKVHAPSLHRVLRALASIGLFADNAQGRFALTPLAELLRSDAPGSLRAYAIMMGERWVWQSWGDIEHSVRTGQPAFEHVFGAPLFGYYTTHPDAGRVSADALNSLSAGDNAALVAAYGFPESGTVIDVGGGQGTLLAAIMAANPGLRGVLLERPAVLEMARSRLAAADVGARCDLVGGDFFAEIPGGGDFYLMKKVIHDWSDEAALSILTCCRAAMPTTARLLLAEQVMPEGNQPSAAKWLDLLMLVYAGGMERTEAEYRDLLAAAGFAINRIMPTAAAVRVIEAIPV